MLVLSEFRVNFRRPDDHFVMSVIFVNLQMAPDNPQLLVRSDSKISSYLIFEFPPQSFGEESFQENPRQTVPPIPSAKIRMAQSSRVTVTMPVSETSLSYTLEAVLEAFHKWPMAA